MGTPEISIVLPTHNRAALLPEAIQSCLDQTLSDFELIIVDDGSTDETSTILEQFSRKDQRIRILTNRTNRGLPASLNIGFATSAGSLLTWTSDDNLYRPRALEAMRDYLKSNPEAAMVYSAFSYFDQLATYPCNVEPPHLLYHHNCVQGCFLYRREVWETVGPYDEELATAEDYDYWLCIMAKFRIDCLDEDLYLYRRHSGSLTATVPEKVFRATRETLIRHLAEAIKAGGHAEAMSLIRIAQISRQLEDYPQARKAVARAFSSDFPFAMRKTPRDLLLDIYIHPRAGDMGRWLTKKLRP